MDEETIEYKVIITSKGEQIPVQSSSGITVGVFPSGDTVKQEVVLDITADEFTNLQKLAVTNDIPADILKEKKADKIE